MAIGCAVLAAGCSERLGRPKQLELVGGQTLIARALSATRGADVAEIAVVVGARGAEVARGATGWGAAILENRGWREGMASSVRTAAAWSRSRRHEGLVLVVCDQPRLSSDHLNAMIAAYRRSGGPIASTYAETRGVPALFPALFLGDLERLSGVRGAGSLLRGVEVTGIAWPDGELDVDTEADLSRAERSIAAPREVAPGGLRR